MNRDLIIALVKNGWAKYGNLLYKMENYTLKYIIMNEETKQLEMHAMTIEKAIEEKILPLGILESTLDLEENE